MVDFGDASNRFVCPNDRQLALRAKLKTGWSMKTAAFQKGPVQNQPLASEEQEAILKVIQRAERLDHTEQERVGKLIDRLETMRRNAMGRSSNQCLLCGDGFGLMGSHKVICVDCKQPACHKCSIEASSTSKKFHALNRTQKEQYLCMICAETREIWKKSGAWFFKSLPKYVLPAENSGFNRHRASRASNKSSKSARMFKEDSSSSDEDRRIWNRMKRRNSNTESTHDIQNASLLASSGLYPAYRQTLTPADPAGTKEPDTLRSYLGNMSINDGRSSRAENTSDLSRLDTSSASGSELSRRDSLASRSIKESYWSDNKSDDKISPGSSSVSSSISKNMEEDHKSIDSSMGTIELSLNYDQETLTLHCTVYRCKNLIPMDINGLADPFCKLNILPNAKVSTRLRTKTVHKTRNPEFNENLTFYDISDTDLKHRSMHVLVVDDDKYGHDYMGEVRIHLAKLKIQNTIYVTMPLENLRPEQKGPLPSPELNQWFDESWSRGQVLLSLGYSTRRRALLVTIIKCTNLLPMDNNGFSDPFIKLQLKPDPYHKKHKTTIKWKNLNPVYNEEFYFETRPTELYNQSLYLTVFDKDYGKSNDYLGGLILGGTGSKGQRLKHWLDMIRYPDHRHEAWHNLTEDFLE